MANKLTPEALKRASKIAVKGMRPLDSTWIQAIRAVNRANEFVPLIKKLSDEKRKELEKIFRSKKKR